MPHTTAGSSWLPQIAYTGTAKRFVPHGPSVYSGSWLRGVCSRTQRRSAGPVRPSACRRVAPGRWCAWRTRSWSRGWSGGRKGQGEHEGLRWCPDTRRRGKGNQGWKSRCALLAPRNLNRVYTTTRRFPASSYWPSLFILLARRALLSAVQQGWPRRVCGRRGARGPRGVLGKCPCRSRSLHSAARHRRARARRPR